MELEELEQDGDVNNSGVGGKKYNKKLDKRNKSSLWAASGFRRGPGGSISKDKKKKEEREEEEEIREVPKFACSCSCSCSCRQSHF